MTVLRNSLARRNARHLRIKRLVQFIFVGAVYHNALTNCAVLLSPRGPSLALRAIHLVPRLRRLSGLCSSNVSDPANRLRKTRKKKSSAVLLFEAVAGLWSAPDYPRERQEFKEEGHSFNPRTAREQCLAAYGQTAGGPSFLPQPQARQSPALRRAQLLAEFQRKTLRPLGTNTLAQFEYPAQPVLRNAVRIGRTACAVRASQRVGAGIACVAVKPPQLHINYVCVTPTYTV